MRKFVFKTATLVSVLHAPGMAMNVVEQSLKEEVEKWRKALQEDGFDLSKEEARVLLEDFRADPDLKHRLLVLGAAIDEFLPAIKALEHALASH